MPEYYHSPRWSAEVADCAMPMTFDQHSNCSFGCGYCFASFQRGIGEGKEEYMAKKVKAVNMDRVIRIFSGDPAFQFADYINARKTVQWGGLSDPFDGFERRLGTGLNILRFLRKIDYPLSFSTKAVWWADDPRYAELFQDNPNWHVKVSIITDDEAKAKKIELGCPSPSKRLDLMEKIAGWNCAGATLRLRPFIIGVSSPGHCDLIRAAADRGAISISTEFFCMERRSPVLKTRLPAMSECAGFDLTEFYKKYSVSHGYLRLNRNVKRRYVDEMEATCREKGIGFFISDAHFKERSDHGGCCGLPPHMTVSQGQFTEAAVLCRKRGKVTWTDIAWDMGHLKGVSWRYAEGYNIGPAEYYSQFQKHTLYQYLRWLWNNPKAGQSPYTMFEGVMKPEGKDENGDLIYVFDPSRA